MEYEWDPEKDRINLEKHGVSFGEASTVFLDPLHVAHTDREDRIRIITAPRRNAQREATL